MKISNSIPRLFLFIFFPVLILTGCSDSPTADDTEQFPESDISFSEHIQPVFNNHCAPCHINQTQNGVNLASYSNVMGSRGDQYNSEIVLPGNPNESPLIDKIEANPEVGGRMPPGNPLNNEQIRAIRTWIEEGAENN